MAEDIMTLAEVAHHLRVEYARAAELARTGLLPHFRLGRQIRVSRADLDQFIHSGGKALPGVWRREPTVGAQP